MATENNLRIDKWLWAVRIFKTRSQASEACKRDKVIIDGIPVKASRTIKIDEIVEVKKNPVVYKYKVKGLLEKRLGAKLISNFVENITPEEELIKLNMIKNSPYGYRRKGFGRPTKKERRVIGRLSDKHSDS